MKAHLNHVSTVQRLSQMLQGHVVAELLCPGQVHSVHNLRMLTPIKNIKGHHARQPATITARVVVNVGPMSIGWEQVLQAHLVDFSAQFSAAAQHESVTPWNKRGRRRTSRRYLAFLLRRRVFVEDVWSASCLCSITSDTVILPLDRFADDRTRLTGMRCYIVSDVVRHRVVKRGGSGTEPRQRCWVSLPYDVLFHVSVVCSFCDAVLAVLLNRLYVSFAVRPTSPRTQPRARKDTATHRHQHDARQNNVEPQLAHNIALFTW